MAEKSIETKLRDELKECKDENAQLKADLRKCKHVLLEFGIGVKKFNFK